MLSSQLNHFLLFWLVSHLFLLRPPWSTNTRGDKPKGFKMFISVFSIQCYLREARNWAPAPVMCTTSVSPSFAVSRHSRLQPFDDRNSERQVAAYRAVETSKAKNCEFKRSLVKCMLLLHFMIVLFSKESVFRQKNRSNVQLLGAWRSPAVTARRSTRQHRISVLKKNHPVLTGSK